MSTDDRQTHRSFHNHSSPNYYYGNHQELLYSYTNYSSYAAADQYFARQFWYQISVFEPPLPYYSVVVSNHTQYRLILSYHVSYYELIEDHIYVAADSNELIETSGMLDYNNFIIHQPMMMTDQERNSSIDFGSLNDYLSYILDDIYDHDEEREDDDDVLKYLKIRTHHVPAKDEFYPKVVDVVELEICAICQSENGHEENIGTLKCGHEYHVDCIKQWLLRKKECPMCRASVLPSQSCHSTTII